MHGGDRHYSPLVLNEHNDLYFLWHHFGVQIIYFKFLHTMNNLVFQLFNSFNGLRKQHWSYVDQCETSTSPPFPQTTHGLLTVTVVCAQVGGRKISTLPAWGGEFEPKELKEKLRRVKVKSSISQVSGSEEKVSKVYNQGTKLLTH